MNDPVSDEGRLVGNNLPSSWRPFSPVNIGNTRQGETEVYDVLESVLVTNLGILERIPANGLHNYEVRDV